jgi:hypothetical protein
MGFGNDDGRVLRLLNFLTLSIVEYMQKYIFPIIIFALLLISGKPIQAAVFMPGDLIKDSQPAVYYYGANGKRYVFPTEKTYFSWYSNFNNVKTISDAELAALPIGGNVTYRPGVRLVKITTDPKVYAVDAHGTLRHISSEALAVQLYGQNWNKTVDDIADAFFSNYTIGNPIVSSSDYSPSSVTLAAQSINVDKGLSALIQGSAPKVGSCQIFPTDNPWNQDVSKLPVNAKSQTYIASIGASKTLHPDFGGAGEYGIPFDVVSASQAKVPINFTAYGDESDPGPYPIPPAAKIEGGANSDGDRHVLVLDKDNCKLYELYNSFKVANGWNADAGAVFDLKTNALRPEGWTSADAAGLPIYPGLVKYEEVANGVINHAIRFTVQHTQKGYIHPATHQAGINNTDLPPMGLRVRLKADYDISKFTGQARVILEAMKKYGMILADNGSSWFFQGDTDPRWNDDDLNQLKSVPGSAFEAVDTGAINR